MHSTDVRKWPVIALALACSGCDLSMAGREHQVESMDAERKLIGVVQGAGATSPLLGETVLVEGMVVRNLMGDSDDIGQEVKETLGEGDSASSSTIGWFVQDEGDGNPATSDGLFVLDLGYDTSISMPADTEYTTRMGARVRTGDRVTVRGKVVELPLAQTLDQARSTGHRVSRGDAHGTVTAIAATSLTLVAPGERATTITVAPATVDDESTEGMRL